MSTVVECGWAGVKNGKLLTLAATRFDVFLTADQNLQYQQNLAALPVAVMVLVAHDNRLETLRMLVTEILASLAELQACSLVRIGV